MICKCGSSETKFSTIVIQFDQDTLMAECAVSITCTNCRRLLANGNAIVTLNPLYHNMSCSWWVALSLSAARKERGGLRDGL